MYAKALLSLIGLASLALAQDESKDLGSVLAGNKDLSTFYDLIKVRLNTSTLIPKSPL